MAKQIKSFDDLFDHLYEKSTTVKVDSAVLRTGNAGNSGGGPIITFEFDDDYVVQIKKENGKWKDPEVIGKG